MKWYIRFCTALEILLETAPTESQTSIVNFLKAKGIEPMSKPTLTRYLDLKLLKSNSPLSNEKLDEKFKGLTDLLEERLKLRSTNRYEYKNGNYVNEENAPYALLEWTKESQAFDSKRAGIIKIHTGIPYDEITKGFDDSKKRIRVIDTYLTNVELYKKHFEKALRRNCEVQILLVAPKSMIAKLRSKGLIEEGIDVQLKVKENIKQLNKLFDNPNFSLRVYDEIPGLNLFAFDDRIFCGWFWYKRYAVDGSYLEIVSNEQSLLAMDINAHWNNLWKGAIAINRTEEPIDFTIIYKCHFLREGSFQSFNLKINLKKKEVLLTGTKSGDNYFGHITELTGYCYITAETNYQFGKASTNDRIASFLINTGMEPLGQQEVAIAVYSNISPSGRTYGNIMILEKEKSETQDQRQHHQSLIELYLKNSELSISDSNIHNFEDLKRALREQTPDRNLDSQFAFLAKLQGDYIMYIDRMNEHEKFIESKTLRIEPNGSVLFQGNTVESYGKVTWSKKSGQ